MSCRALILAVAVCLLARPVFPQKKNHLPEKYAHWLNQEVVYIITDEEKKQFLHLEADAEREKFVQDFWEVRNPVPGAKRNAFKEEHYRRIQYANERFGRLTNTPGWMTDMGRTYILFGKPASQTNFTGYGQLYPLELWFYSNSAANPSFPSFFYVLFFVPEDIGEYRFYHPIIDGPMKLVRGSQFHANRDVYYFLKPLGGDVAHAAFSLNPSEPLDTDEFSPSMSGEMLVNKIQNFANDSFNVRRIREMRTLHAKITSWFLVNQNRPLDTAAIALKDPSGRYWLDYAILVDDPNLGRREPAGDRLIVSAWYRLLSESGDLIVEDEEERAYPAFERVNGEERFKPFLLASRIPVIPGTFKLEIQLLNREAGRTYKVERHVILGDSGALSLTEPLLVASVEQVARPEADTPFQYFGIQFVPSLSGSFGREDPIRVLFQIQEPAADARSYQMDYMVAHLQDRESRRSFTDLIPRSEFRNESLLKAKTLPLTGLEAGGYRLVLSLRAEDSSQVLASVSVPLRIGEKTAQPGMFFLSNYRSATQGGIASYIRGLESLALKNSDGAAGYFREALESNPSNELVGRTLVQIYFNQHKFEQVTSLYNRLGLAPFKAAPETLAQVALSLWQSGDARSATRVLESAQTFFPKNVLLTATSKQIEGGAPATRPVR